MSVTIDKLKPVFLAALGKTTAAERAAYLDEVCAGDAALRHGVEEQLPRVTAPTLVVRGPDDPIVPQNWAETVAGLLPAGQLVVTATGAHTLIDQLIEVSLPFLERHLPPPSGNRGATALAGERCGQFAQGRLVGFGVAREGMHQAGQQRYRNLGADGQGGLTRATPRLAGRSPPRRPGHPDRGRQPG